MQGPAAVLDLLGDSGKLSRASVSPMYNGSMANKALQPAPGVSWLLDQSSLSLGHMGKPRQGTAKQGWVALSWSALPPPQARWLLSSPAPSPHHGPIPWRPWWWNVLPP